jgi:4-carboxymuconolactone decarboxylase
MPPSPLPTAHAAPSAPLYAGLPTPADRHARGLAMLAAVDGPAGLAVVEQLSSAFPDFARYLVEFPFGDVYAREGLGLREREIATVAALCALGTAPAQLRVHVHAALHVGCQPAEVVEVVMQMAVYAGFPAALNGLRVVREVFAECGITLPLEKGSSAPQAGPEPATVTGPARCP